MSSKMLDATCNSIGKVTASGSLVPDAQVLSEGKQASTGVLLIEQDKARYLTSSATDVKTVIEKLESILTDLAAALNSIGAQITGLGGDGSTAISKATSLTATKTALTTLKGALK